MKEFIRRITALILAVNIMVSCVPLQVFAEDEVLTDDIISEEHVHEETELALEIVLQENETTEDAEETEDVENTVDEQNTEESSIDTESALEYADKTYFESMSETSQGYEEDSSADDDELNKNEVIPFHDIDTNRLHNAIAIYPGQLMPEDCSIVENDIYGYVVNYPLKKGHILSISDKNYVFSVRKLVDGNYSTMLKQATADSFTATEDITTCPEPTTASTSPLRFPLPAIYS